MWHFTRGYLYTLVNAWFFWAGGALTLNEIVGVLRGRSWELPRRHRLTAFLFVLVIAQVGAYKSLMDESNQRIKDAEAKVQPQSPVVAENPDHAAQLAKLNDVREHLDTTTLQVTELRNQLNVTTTALVSSQNQVVDLQQQLERAKQPPAVVVQGGVVVNQPKMTQIAALLQLGRRLQSSAPRKGAAAESAKPWVVQVDGWYRGALAFLRKECTPQALAIFDNRSGQLPMSYGAIHEDQTVQNTFGALDHLLGNMTGLLQRPEMCP